jgi:hypothetical protein
VVIIVRGIVMNCLMISIKLTSNWSHIYIRFQEYCNPEVLKRLGWFDYRQ